MLPAVLSPAARRRGVSAAGAPAFTLLEVMTVLGVIVILAAVSIGTTAQSLRNRAHRLRAQADLTVIAVAVEAFRRHHGEYPRTAAPSDLFAALAGRRSVTNTPITPPGRIFLEPDGLTWAPLSSGAGEAVALDPWGNPYRYVHAPGPGWRAPGFVLYSAGPDGTAGSHATGAVPGVTPADADNVYLP